MTLASWLFLAGVLGVFFPRVAFFALVVAGIALAGRF